MLDDERRGVGEGELEIFGREREIAGDELLVRLSERRWRFSTSANRRWSAISQTSSLPVADPLHVEPPRRVAGTVPELGEDIEREPVAVARQRPDQRLAIAFAHDHPGRSRRELETREIARRRSWSAVSDNCPA